MRSPPIIGTCCASHAALGRGKWKCELGSRNSSAANSLFSGPRRCALLKKCHRADFDAFARPRMRRGGGILERGMCSPARAAVLHRIKHLEYIGLLAPHARDQYDL